ncbi:MAG: outer membrane protein [Alphaproteobacteria bacterium]
MIQKIAAYIFCFFCFLHNASANDGRACCVGKQPHWYLGIGGGITFLDDMDVEESSPTGLTQAIQHDMGFNFSGQLGYRIIPNARLELEGIYIKNKVDKYVGGTLDAGSNSANKTYAVMANGYFDFFRSREVNPYIGAGIGSATITTPIVRGIAGEDHRLKDEWILAYQFMAGANFPVPETPFYFSLGYRYFTTQDAEVEYTATPGYNVKFNHTSHNIELGGKLYF